MTFAAQGNAARPLLAVFGATLSTRLRAKKMQKSPANEFPPPAKALLWTFNTQDAHRQNPRLGRSPHVTIKHRPVVQVLRDIAARRNPSRNRNIDTEPNRPGAMCLTICPRVASKLNKRKATFLVQPVRAQTIDIDALQCSADRD
jgi:hypothetical protein